MVDVRSWGGSWWTEKRQRAVVVVVVVGGGGVVGGCGEVIAGDTAASCRERAVTLLDRSLAVAHTCQPTRNHARYAHCT